MKKSTGPELRYETLAHYCGLVASVSNDVVVLVVGCHVVGGHTSAWVASVCDLATANVDSYV